MVSEEILNKIAEITAKDPARSGLLAELKKDFPDMIFRTDSDDNITGTEPVRTGDDFALYLIDTGNHCHTLTRDREAASGVLIGLFTED